MARIRGLKLRTGAGSRHAALLTDVARCGHVGDEKIEQAVVVDVAEVGAHRIVRLVWYDVMDDVGERAVSVISIQPVRSGKVVCDVDVRPAVVVEVPPGRGVSGALAGDPGV